MNIDEIKFKDSRQRIDYLLGCLSGVITSQYSKVTLLQALYKEMDNMVENTKQGEEERKHIINLFNMANDKNNMTCSIEGWGNARTYHHREEFLNEIELYLRKLLRKYGHYALEKKKVDYQLGEE